MPALTTSKETCWLVQFSFDLIVHRLLQVNSFPVWFNFILCLALYISLIILFKSIQNAKWTMWILNLIASNYNLRYAIYKIKISYEIEISYTKSHIWNGVIYITQQPNNMGSQSPRKAHKCPKKNTCLFENFQNTHKWAPHTHTRTPQI